MFARLVYEIPTFVSFGTLLVGGNLLVGNVRQYQVSTILPLSHYGTITWSIGSTNANPTTLISGITIDQNGLITIDNTKSMALTNVYVIGVNPNGAFGSLLVPMVIGSEYPSGSFPDYLVSPLGNTTLFALGGLIYGNGLYTVRTSSTYTSENYFVFEKFNLATVSWWQTFWATSTPSYNGVNSAYTGSFSTSLSGGGTILGEWIDIQMPNAEALVSYTIKARDIYPLDTPGSWNIYGSNDGNTYTLIHSITNQSWFNQNEIRSYNAYTTTAYKWFRIVIIAGNQAGNDGYVSIGKWVIYAV